jgi:hypothetical protein
MMPSAAVGQNPIVGGVAAAPVSSLLLKPSIVSISREGGQKQPQQQSQTSNCSSSLVQKEFCSKYLQKKPSTTAKTTAAATGGQHTTVIKVRVFQLIFFSSFCSFFSNFFFKIN